MQEEENLKVIAIPSVEALNTMDERYYADWMRDIWGWTLKLYYLSGLKKKIRLTIWSDLRQAMALGQQGLGRWLSG